MALLNRRVICAIVASPSLVACGPEDDGADAVAESSTGATSEDPPGTTSTTDDTGSTGSEASATDADSDTGEPPGECPVHDETVSAAFTVTIDGTSVLMDDLVTPEGWQSWDELPEIDGMCDVVEPSPDTLTVTCADTMGVDRTFSLELAVSEALATTVGKGPVHVWYIVLDKPDRLGHVSHSKAHGFVVSNETGIVLAGIDGLFALARLGDAWPEWPTATIASDRCLGSRGEVKLELEDGATLEVFDGSVSDLGPYRVLVETAESSSRFDGEQDVAVERARWVLGLPQ